MYENKYILTPSTMISSENVELPSHATEKASQSVEKTKKCKKEEPLKNTCEICADNFNKTAKIPIKCEYCEFTACRKCCNTFILNETEPKCMNTATCNRTWTRQFISLKLTKQFINTDLKKHKEQILYERERSLLPSTQPLVEYQIKVEKIDEELREMQNILFKIRENIRNKIHEKNSIINRFNSGTREPQQRATFIRACPDNECRGFLSSQWKCGLCEKWTCSQCYVIKGLDRNLEEHVCNPGDIETAALILKETKSCPSCGMGIFKIDGCDQMFCTECKTAFDWKTGKIQTNNIHNPHYFQWLRRTQEDRENGRTEEIPPQENNECNDPRNGFVLNHYVCTRLRNRVNVKYSPIPDIIKGKITNFEKIVRRAIHLQEVEMVQYNDNLNFITNNQELRIKYLRKQIDETQFKVLLQRRDKRREKNIEIYNILQMVFNVTTDIIYRINYPISKSMNWDETVFEPLIEIPELVKYANECLLDVSKTYHVRPLVLDNNLKLV
jgi:hypothetical protein